MSSEQFSPQPPPAKTGGQASAVAPASKPANRVIGGLAILAVGGILVFGIYKFSSSSKPGGDKKERTRLFDPEENEFPRPFTGLDAIDALVGQDKPSQFGIDRVKDKGAKPAPFDGKRAMTYLEKICALGPRISGSPAMKKQQDLIIKHFEDLGARVTLQKFTARQNSQRGEVDMTNIIVSYHPEKKRRVILCSHYDTRPIADQEADPRDWRKPFVSANDGGSGVALLMELGNHMKDLKLNVGVDFVIFDGEEYIFVTEGGNRDRYFIGSEHFALNWRKAKDRPEYTAAILLDMIAGRKLSLPVEVNSYRRAPELCAEIYSIAREQGVKAFYWEKGHEVQDDHISLQKVGIPAIDLIDFDYPHWHKLTDTPANCSGDSMEKVAGVLSVFMQRTK